MGERLSELGENVGAVWSNEQITRNRVSKIEDVLSRGLLGRLRWLLFGS